MGEEIKQKPTSSTAHISQGKSAIPPQGLLSTHGPLGVLERMAAEKGFDSPMGIFRLETKEKERTLWSFVQKAQEEGHSDRDIRELILAYKDVMKLLTSEDVSQGQVASVYLHSTTRSKDYFKDLEGDAPIIVNGVLRNGLFGNVASIQEKEDIEKLDDLTVMLYMRDSCFKNNEPIAAYVLLAGRSRYNTSFNKAVGLVRARFEKLVEDMDRTTVPRMGDRILFTNPNDGSEVSVPIIGLVYDKQERKDYVIEFGAKGNVIFEATEYFSKPSNIAKLLGVEVGKLKELEKLVGMSWQEKQAVAPELAQLAESYEIILRHSRNRKRAEESITDEGIWLASFLSRTDRHSCVDSRQIARGTKSFGAHMTVEEMLRVLAKPEIDELLIVPHHGCGYIQTLTALQNLSIAMTRRPADGIDEKKAREARSVLSLKLMGLFEGRITGPMLEKDAFECYMKVLGVSPDLEKTFRAIFVGNNQLLRNALKYAYETGVVRWRDMERREKNGGRTGDAPRSVPMMVAAREVDRLIKRLKCEDEITPQMRDILITEEFARQIQESAPRVEGKNVSVRTQMLEDMSSYENPPRAETRSELLDWSRNRASIGKLAPRDIAYLIDKGFDITFNITDVVGRGGPVHH